MIVGRRIFLGSEESCEGFCPAYQLLTEIFKLMRVLVDVGSDLLVVIRPGASRHLSAIEDAIYCNVFDSFDVHT